MQFRNPLILFVLLSYSLPLFAYDYVTCESKDDRRTYCDVRNMRDSTVELERKFSKSSCIEGRSWGTDSRGIWVEDGCRAEFRVSSRYDSGSHYDSYRDDRSEELRLEREKLEIARQKLELERQRTQQSQSNTTAQVNQDHCPPGSQPGRCTDKQRKNRQCKDFRTPGGLGCMTMSRL
ncbi:MAG: DUF3011 domain-containing protein [Bdellovibrionales bacterium]|nr:DUF3011 domain-containing protein [Bdellovibrionales bacterium]